jgi:uncharacterized protein
MKVNRVAVFFSVVFLVYFLINAYVIRRGMQCFPAGDPLRSWILWTGLLLTVSFILGRVLENYWLSHVSDVFVWIGSFWLAALTYFFFAVLVIDILRVSNAIIPWFPDAITADPVRSTRFIFWSVTSLVALLVVAGHINARFPRIHRITVPIAKHADDPRPVRLALISDIHLGTIVGRSRLQSIVRHLEDLNPDLILLAGDIVDEDLGPVIKENTGEILRTIHAPMGVFGITGNHEYIGGAARAVAYLEEHGITMLRDSIAVLSNGITLVGREDRSSRQFGGERRKDLATLLAGVRHDRPIVMMDHQPFDLDSVVAAGVDLQLSGHTHHGQLWPFNHITNMVYEQSWGYLRKGATQFYVSSGVGSWGPPVRIANRPEIVEITLTFAEH